jgi:hypothetical protein
MRWLILCTLLACSGESPKDSAPGDDPGDDPGGDADTDADSDADTDTDADTDVPQLDCVDGALDSEVPQSLAGSTTGAGDDWSPACSAGDGEDIAFSFVAPSAGRFLFDTLDSSFDTVLYVLDGCEGGELACNDDYGGPTSAAPADLEAGQGVVVVVDGFQETGAFTLHVSEIPAIEGQCEDGLDEDFDGRSDCLDPDCPPCSDCADLLLGAAPSSISGTTAGEPDSAIGSCDTSFGVPAPDVHVGFTAPVQGRYAFRLTENTEFDSILYVLDGCGGTELGCDDYFDAFGSLGQEVVVVELAVNQYVVAVVDGYSGLSGDFELEVVMPPLVESACAWRPDEDLDGLADCLDPDCAAVGTCVPACPDLALVSASGSVSATTWGYPDETQGSCDFGYFDATDVQISFTAPVEASYVFQLATDTEFDTVLYVLDACGGAELGCADFWGTGELLALRLSAGQQVVAVVDGSQGQSGAFELVVGQATANEVGLCFDSLDNDADLLADCFDPDCAAEPACGEVCDDDLDDNGDGLVDCLDVTCKGEAVCEELCPELVLSGALPLQVAGNNLGATDNYVGSCNANIASDTTYTFTAPSAGTYTIDTIGTGLDTVLYVQDVCGGVELACNDDIDVMAGDFQSELQVTLAAGQTVIVVVDGYSSWSAGPYLLNVSL